MESDPTFERFRENQRRTYARLDELRMMTEDLLDRIAEGTDLIPLVAQYEGLRAERSEVFARHLSLEEQFIDHVLKLKA